MTAVLAVAVETGRGPGADVYRCRSTCHRQAKHGRRGAAEHPGDLPAVRDEGVDRVRVDV